MIYIQWVLCVVLLAATVILFMQWKLACYEVDLANERYLELQERVNRKKKPPEVDFLKCFRFELMVGGNVMTVNRVMWGGEANGKASLEVWRGMRVNEKETLEDQMEMSKKPAGLKVVSGVEEVTEQVYEFVLLVMDAEGKMAQTFDVKSHEMITSYSDLCADLDEVWMEELTFDRCTITRVEGWTRQDSATLPSAGDMFDGVQIQGIAEL